MTEDEQAYHEWIIQMLKQTPRERLLERRLRELIQAIEAGELSRNDLVMYTTIKPEQLDAIKAMMEDGHATGI